MTTKRNPQFNVRISPELKEEIVALAEKNKRPINAEINAALEAWVNICKIDKAVFEKNYSLNHDFDDYIIDIENKKGSNVFYNSLQNYLINDSIEKTKEDIKTDILNELLNRIEEFLKERSLAKQAKEIIEMAEKK